MRMAIVGCGYVGSEVVRQAPDDWKLWALSRSAERAAELSNNRLKVVVGDWLNPSTLDDLPEVDVILVSVPHRPVDPHEDQTHCVGLKSVLASFRGWQKLIYLSTTGVYGECESEVVDEQTPVSPTRVGPSIAVKAEEWLSSNVDSARFTTLRLAGIYGPGRVPLAAKLRAGEPLAVPANGYLNLAHVTDISGMIWHLATHQMQDSRYVFSDGKPVQREEFYRYLAECCGVQNPQFTQPDPSDSRVRRATSKRINPTKILDETGFELTYPDYRSGILQSVGD